MKCDYHLHSYYSHDSSTPMDFQIKRAINLGLDELCFTDHVDYFSYDSESAGAKSRYFSEIENQRRKFEGRIKIKAGFEFGVQTSTIRKFETLFESWRDEIDFILLSIHQIDDKDLWSGEYQKGKTQDEYNRGYYEELLNVMKNFHDYSVLAHLDLMVRYDRKGAYPFEKVKDIVTEILTQVINDNKGIELNTSSWRYGLKDTQPCREILKLYRDLGGEILTLGSDAHTPDYLYAHMNEARYILRNEIGFKYICTFDKMRPVFHEL